MKQFKLVLFSTLSFIALIAIVLTSCNNNGDVVYGPTTYYKPCEKVYCLNGGTCIDGQCKCPVGFEGSTCEIKSSAKFIGSYLSFDNCYTGPNNNYPSTITGDNQNAGKLVLNNLGTYCVGFPLIAYIDATGSSFAIPMQASCGNYYIQGSGSLNGTILNVYLSARDSVNHTSTNCSVVMNKQ